MAAVPAALISTVAHVTAAVLKYLALFAAYISSHYNISATTSVHFENDEHALNSPSDCIRKLQQF